VQKAISCIFNGSSNSFQTLFLVFKMQAQPVIQALHKYAGTFHQVVPFANTKEHLLQMDFTADNKNVTEEIYSDINKFSAYINDKLEKTGSKYGIGGYNEMRTIYAASKHFDAGAEPRRLHLGVDIWGLAGTPITAFMGGRIHSFAFNDNKGDYGATLILMHQLDGFAFHTLYGHISLKDIENLTGSQYVVRGQPVAHFGKPEENGHWPPHLHFQVIIDMQLKQGDYPGVCKLSEREKYIQNCPDPDLILQMNQYLKVDWLKG
jgi:murein DD-endopeptidase MepM/ murein hydrolase activator NlpD